MGNFLLVEACVAKHMLISQHGIIDPAPKLFYKDLLPNSMLKMDPRRVTRACNPSNRVFFRAMASGIWGSGDSAIRIPGRDSVHRPEFLALSWYYEQLYTVFVRFAFSRRSIASRTHPLYVEARSAFNRIMEWYLENNPDFKRQHDFCIPREAIEVLCSIMIFFEDTLEEIEAINASLPGTLEIAIEPGRMNSSPAEHFFAGFRHSCGHDVLNGPALERLFKRKVATLLLEWKRDGLWAQTRDAYRGLNNT